MSTILCVILISFFICSLKEKIQVYESISSSSVSKEISSTDFLAFAFGIQKHCGRVRGLGLGPCPYKVFCSKGHSYSRTSSNYPSNAQLQNQVSFLVLIMMHYFYQIWCLNMFEVSRLSMLCKPRLSKELHFFLQNWKIRVIFSILNNFEF